VRYVALGDSYASGEGNPPFDQGTDVPGPNGDHCRRSAKAYPRVLRVKTKVALTHRACSGAQIDDLLTNARSPAEPPQLTWVDPSAQVVTVMIGGNDAGFSPVLDVCFIPRSPCMALEPVVQAHLQALAQRLPDLYLQVRQRAPTARVLVIGYPQIFPDPARVTIEGCGMLNFRGIGIHSSQVAWLSEKTTQLDDVLQTAARAAGVQYVDTLTALAGHEVCTHTPWVYGALPLVSNASFHPAAAGHKALASRVAAVLTTPPAR
jgi:lysophospholipase L1-like esterase